MLSAPHLVLNAEYNPQLATIFWTTISYKGKYDLAGYINTRNQPHPVSLCTYFAWSLIHYISFNPLSDHVCQGFET